MKTKRPLPKRFSGTIRVSGILVGLIAVLLSAASLATAAPFAYVSSFGQDRVRVVDGANGSVAATITLAPGAMPYGVAVNPAGTRAYVADRTEGLVVLDTADLTRPIVLGGLVILVSGVMPSDAQVARRVAPIQRSALRDELGLTEDQVKWAARRDLGNLTLLRELDRIAAADDAGEPGTSLDDVAIEAGTD
jgi:hypothetical protein